MSIFAKMKTGDESIIKMEDVLPASIEEADTESQEALDDAVGKAEEDAVETDSETDVTEEPAEGEPVVDVLPDAVDGTENLSASSLFKEERGMDFWKEAGKAFALKTDRDILVSLLTKQAVVNELKAAKASNDAKLVAGAFAKHKSKRYTAGQTKALMAAVKSIMGNYDGIVDNFNTIFKSLPKAQTKEGKSAVLVACHNVLNTLNSNSKGLPITGFESKTVHDDVYALKSFSKDLKLAEKEYEAADIDGLITVLEAEIQAGNEYRKSLLQLQGKMIGSGLIATTGSAFKGKSFKTAEKSYRGMVTDTVKAAFKYLKDIHLAVDTILLDGSAKNSLNKVYFEFLEEQADVAGDIADLEEAAEADDVANEGEVTETSEGSAVVDPATDAPVEDAGEVVPADDATATEEGAAETDPIVDDGASVEEGGEVEPEEGEGTSIAEDLVEAENENLDDKIEVIEAIEEVVEEDSENKEGMETLYKLCHKLGFTSIAPDYGIMLPAVESFEATTQVVNDLKALLTCCKQTLISQKK